MSWKPKLLVFIPTYQRPEALKRQLIAIESLRQHNPGLDISVLVSQNESADARRPWPTGEGVQYRGNPVNLGADINIALGFVLCDGYDFLWILSDDDFLRHGNETVALPLEEEFDLLVFDKAPDRIAETRRITAADLLNSRMGLISDVIYRVESIRKSVPEALLNVQSCFPHLSVIADAFSRRDCRIRYQARSRIFDEGEDYAAECVTDYSAARGGIVMTGRYLEQSERRRFALFYARHADLSRLSLTGATGSLVTVAREVASLYALALPVLLLFYLLRKMQNYAHGTRQ